MNKEDLTIKGYSTLSIDNVWRIRFMDNDTIPQVILDIRCNGDIFYKENLIETDKELVTALREVVKGTMESKLLVQKLEAENFKLRGKLSQIEEVINK